MKYVIQNVKTKKYLKHKEKYEPLSYGFYDVNTPEKAEQYSSKEHAEYAMTWHADMSETYEIITLAKQDKRCACHHDQERTPFPLHLVSGHDDAYSIKTKENHSTTPNRMVRETTDYYVPLLYHSRFFQVNKEECVND